MYRIILTVYPALCIALLLFSTCLVSFSAGLRSNHHSKHQRFRTRMDNSKINNSENRTDSKSAAETGVLANKLDNYMKFKVQSENNLANNNAGNNQEQQQSTDDIQLNSLFVNSNNLSKGGLYSSTINHSPILANNINLDNSRNGLVEENADKLEISSREHYPNNHDTSKSEQGQGHPAGSFHEHPRLKQIDNTAVEITDGSSNGHTTEEESFNAKHHSYPAINSKSDHPTKDPSRYENFLHGNSKEDFEVSKRSQSVSRSVRHLDADDDIIYDVSPKSHRPDIVSLKTTVTSQENNELQPLVMGLREELKTVQATHIRTRSVINELQEKQEAQERDMAIFKNELSKLRQEQLAQREQLESLGAVASDLSWALADMKQGQAQTSADFVAFKQVQLGAADDLGLIREGYENLTEEVSRLTREQAVVSGVVKSVKQIQSHHNDTLLVMEEVMMSNALELQTLQQHSSNVRNELESLRDMMTEDRHRLKHIETEFHLQHKHFRTLKENSPTKQKQNSTTKETKPKDWKNTNSNEWIKLEKSTPKIAALSDRRDGLEVELEIDSKFRPGETHISPAKLPQQLPSLHHQQALAEFGLFKSTIQAKLEVQAAEVQGLRDLTGNLTEGVVSLNTTLQALKRKSGMEDQLLNIQLSMVNLTKKLLDEQSNSASVNDLKHHSSDNSSVARIEILSNGLNRTLTELQKSNKMLSDELHRHEDQSSTLMRDIEERMKDLGARVWRAEDQLRQYELGSLNLTLQQCRQANTELRSVSQLIEMNQQINHLDVKVSQQSLLANKLESSVSRLEDLIKQREEMTSSADDQLIQLSGLHGDVSHLKHEVINLITMLPRDCHSAMAEQMATADSHNLTPLYYKQQSTRTHSDGIYLIRPAAGNYSLRVQCVLRQPIPGSVKVFNDQGAEGRGVEEGGGGEVERKEKYGAERVWTVIQRRVDGREKFGRTWDEYKFGFGDVAGEFWLGNEHIHRLTSDQGHEGSRSTYRLRVEIWDVHGRFWLAEYSSIRVDSEANLYKLDLGHYVSGNASDALRYSNLMPFSTLDRDNDISTTHCGQFYESGWWYKHCHYSNLNGRYTSGIVWYQESLDEWLQLNKTMMMISRVEKNSAEFFQPPVTLSPPDGQ